jgi:hypothetical protein
MNITHRKCWAGAWFGLLLLAAAPVASATQLKAAASSASVDGFRSARFGMDEAAVHKAISSDFSLPPTAVQSYENPVTHTTEITIAVPALIDGLGKADVQYVLGYQSHKLTQVTVIWDQAADPANTAAAIIRAAGSLQSYFAHEGFPAASVRANFVASDGDFVLLRAADGQNHTVLLALQGAMSKDKTSGTVKFTPRALAIGYVADAAHPDIFNVPKGAF